MTALMCLLLQRRSKSFWQHVMCSTQQKLPDCCLSSVSKRGDASINGNPIAGVGVACCIMCAQSQQLSIHCQHIHAGCAEV